MESRYSRSTLVAALFGRRAPDVARAALSQLSARPPLSVLLDAHPARRQLLRLQLEPARRARSPAAWLAPRARAVRDRAEVRRASGRAGHAAHRPPVQGRRRAR